MDISRRIEFNKDIRVVIKVDFFRLLADQSKYVLILGLRDRVALRLGHRLAIEVAATMEETAAASASLLWSYWILQLQLQVLNDIIGPLFFNEVQRLGMVTRLGDTDLNKVGHAARLGSQGLLDDQGQVECTVTAGLHVCTQPMDPRRSALALPLYVAH